MGIQAIDSMIIIAGIFNKKLHLIYLVYSCLLCG